MTAIKLLNQSEPIPEVWVNSVLLASMLALPIVSPAQEKIQDDVLPTLQADIPAQAELEQVARSYEDEVMELESSQGVYAPALGENLSSLGLIYQQLGDYDQAIDHYKRAMHIKRVNGGLQGLGQISILEKIIEINIHIKDWESLDQNYDQVLWVYRRNYAEDDPYLLSQVYATGKWKIQTYRFGLLDKEPRFPLNEAERLFSSSISYIKKTHGSNDPRLVQLLYGQALVNYHLLILTMNKPLSKFGADQTIQRITYEYRLVCTNTPNGRICRTQPIPVLRSHKDYGGAQDEKNRLIRMYSTKIRINLKQIISIISKDDPALVEIANTPAFANMDDWSTVNIDETNEPEQRRVLYNFMKKIGIGEKDVDRLFEIQQTQTEPPAITE